MSVDAVARKLRNAIKRIAVEMDMADHRLTTDEVKEISSRTTLSTLSNICWFCFFVICFKYIHYIHNTNSAVVWIYIRVFHAHR